MFLTLTNTQVSVSKTQSDFQPAVELQLPSAHSNLEYFRYLITEIFKFLFKYWKNCDESYAFCRKTMCYKNPALSYCTVY